MSGAVIRFVHDRKSAHRPALKETPHRAASHDSSGPPAAVLNLHMTSSDTLTGSCVQKHCGNITTLHKNAFKADLSAFHVISSHIHYSGAFLRFFDGVAANKTPKPAVPLVSTNGSNSELVPMLKYPNKHVYRYIIIYLKAGED